jgi:hypothetical protein
MGTVQELPLGFRTGVCLHGHTLYSEECLWFLPRYLSHIPGASRLTRSVDFSRAFFTPPLTPADAFRLEWEQVAGLDLEPLVSLTDHDNIEAGFLLSASSSPLSVEWTAPYRGSIFHLGIHNLPPAAARSWMSAMAGYTAKPEEKLLSEILSGLAEIPEALIVLNHPFWREEGVEEAAHGPALDRLLRECVGWLHAFELNGTRVWAENAETVELAETYSRPTISGGDRHGCEPAACINLTNASSFAEFVGEIRAGQSSIHFMPHYRQPMTSRLIEAVCDILRPYPEYPERKRWMDRFFYRDEDGSVESLAALWKNREPWLLRPATGAVQVLTAASVRGALRSYFACSTRPRAAAVS